MQSKFEEDGIYYQCGLEGPGPPVISSWVYLGFQRTPGKSSASCDIPEHFYVFEEWNSWWTRQHFDSTRAYVLNIPSLRQAEMSMLTWEELLCEIASIGTDEG